MELKCPQCGKVLTVSQEELVIHDSQVVCPQCLAVCRYDGHGLVVRDDSDTPYRHTASVKTVSHDVPRFCHSCGKQLPGGISFCPYCGADLKAPFKPTEPEPIIEQQPVEEETMEPVQEEKEPQPVASSRKQGASMEDKLRTMTHRYNSTQPRLHQNGTMPGTAFKIIAYTIIVALLALLVWIIIAGINIETSV